MNQIVINLDFSLLADNLLILLPRLHVRAAFLREPLHLRLESADLLDDLCLCQLIMRIRHSPDWILRAD